MKLWHQKWETVTIKEERKTNPINTIDPSKLDPLEQKLYEDIGGTPEHRIQVLITTVWGDWSQLSPYLRSLAKRMGMTPEETPPRKCPTHGRFMKYIGEQEVERGWPHEGPGKFDLRDVWECPIDKKKYSD